MQRLKEEFLRVKIHSKTTQWGLILDLTHIVQDLEQVI